MTEETEYFDSEDFKEILRQYEESVKSGEHIYMDADDLTDIADYYNYLNRNDEAEEAIALATEYNPDAIGPMLYKARKALNAEDFETAEAYADKVQVHDSLEAVYLRAEILIKQGNIEESDKILSEYSKDVPTDEYADYVKVIIQLYLEYNEFLKAFEWTARFTGSDNEEFQELMARTLFGMGKYMDSERLFNELLDKNPYSAEYWNALSGVQYMKQDYSGALSSSEYALAINPDDADGLMSKANTLFTMDNYDEALIAFQKYSEQKPDDEYGYLQQALCLINKGDYSEEGLELLRKAVSVSDVESIYLPEIYQEMSFVYNKLGNLDKALWCLDMLDKLDCDHVHLQVTRGHLLLNNKKEKEAKKEFDKALKMSDNSPNTMLQIIVSYQDNMYLDYAYSLFLKLFNEVGDGWDEGYSYMALCCNDLKKDDEFLYYLKKACNQNPTEAQMVLRDYFPEDMDPKDYYDYALIHLND